MTSVDIYSLNGLPAPYWFIQLFKVLGFILHSIPMHLWLAGLPLALILLLIGGANGKTFARRLLKQMPIIMAFGINLGIVPLLFIQVAYYKVFYPATILMAWHWLGILALVLPAYYLLYLTGALVDSGQKWRPALSGLVASVLLVAAGLIFTGAWTLMSAPESWPELWRAKSLAGAATGFGSNWSDPVVFLRFVSICGLALLTVTFWLLFDSHVLFTQKKSVKRPASGRPKPQITDFMDNPYLSEKRKQKLQYRRRQGQLSEEEELEALEYGYGDTEPQEEENVSDRSVDSEAYQRWTKRFASVLVWFGACVAFGSLWFYYYKVLDGPDSVTGVHEASMVSDPSQIEVDDSAPERIVPIWLPPVTFAGIGLFAIVTFLGSIGKLEGKLLVTLVGLAEAVTLTFFAITRQIIQNEQIKDYLDVRSIPVQLQLSPLLVFLLVFLFGAALVYWMVYAMAKTVKR
ncbi:MAG: hypothetical protein ACOX6D_04645 [Thermoguttaceae bacterium]|jgi:hypothetical protein